MPRPVLTRHRHGAKRYTSKRIAEATRLQLSCSGPAHSQTWETFSVGVRDIEGTDGYDVTFDRAEAEKLYAWLGEHLEAVLPTSDCAPVDGTLRGPPK